MFGVPDGSHDAAVALGKELRSGQYEAVAGIGGGKTIDVTKFAAHMAGIPMVSVATSLAHDGIASPISTLTHESGTSSFGVVPPVAVVVDLDRVRGSTDRAVHGRASGTWSATCPRSPTGSSRPRTLASRSTGSPWRWPGRPRTPCCTSRDRPGPMSS